MSTSHNDASRVLTEVQVLQIGALSKGASVMLQGEYPPWLPTAGHGYNANHADEDVKGVHNHQNPRIEHVQQQFQEWKVQVQWHSVLK